MTPALKAALERVERAIAIDGISGCRTMANTSDLRLILAALDDLDWRPIGTAPYNGRFDVWVSSGPYRVTVCWRQRDGLIYALTGDGRSYSVLGATHWRPLPAPPLEVKG